MFMSYGLWILTKLAKLDNTKANPGMISIHIIAYVLCILAVYLGYIDPDSVKVKETT